MHILVAYTIAYMKFTLFIFVLCPLYTMLPFTLDCPFLIAFGFLLRFVTIYKISHVFVFILYDMKYTQKIYLIDSFWFNYVCAYLLWNIVNIGPEYVIIIYIIHLTLSWQATNRCYHIYIVLTSGENSLFFYFFVLLYLSSVFYYVVSYCVVLYYSLYIWTSTSAMYERNMFMCCASCLFCFDFIRNLSNGHLNTKLVVIFIKHPFSRNGYNISIWRCYQHVSTQRKQRTNTKVNTRCSLFGYLSLLFVG
jgi:hypothetical protein